MASVQKIRTNLWFDSNAEEAAKFYCSLFPNSKITFVAHYGDAGPGPKGSVMVVEFELSGQSFIAINGGPMFKFSEAISLEIMCKDQKEVDFYWNALTKDGGAESMCGWCRDKYGLSWQVVPAGFTAMMKSGNEAGINRAFSAMMKMRKLDAAALEKAFAG